MAMTERRRQRMRMHVLVSFFVLLLVLDVSIASYSEADYETLKKISKNVVQKNKSAKGSRRSLRKNDKGRNAGKGGKGGKGGHGSSHHSGAGWTSSGSYIGCFTLSAQYANVDSGTSYNCTYAIYGYGQSPYEMYANSGSGSSNGSGDSHSGSHDSSEEEGSADGYYNNYANEGGNGGGDGSYSSETPVTYGYYEGNEGGEGYGQNIQYYEADGKDDYGQEMNYNDQDQEKMEGDENGDSKTLNGSSMAWSNGIDPFMAFQIEHCDTYEGLWEWDLAMTCGEGERGRSNRDCICTWTELFMEEGELDCSAIFDCPEDCPVCRTCLHVAGCDDHGHLLVNQSKRYAGGIFTMFAIAIILGCHCAKTQRRQRDESDSLSVQLMEENDLSDDLSSACEHVKVWMAPVEFMEAGEGEKDVWLVPDNMSYTTRSEASSADYREQGPGSDNQTHPDSETPSIPSGLRPKTKKTGKLKKSKKLAVGFMSELFRFRFYRPKRSKASREHKEETRPNENQKYICPNAENEHIENKSQENPAPVESQLEENEQQGAVRAPDNDSVDESKQECQATDSDQGPSLETSKMGKAESIAEIEIPKSDEISQSHQIKVQGGEQPSKSTTSDTGDIPKKKSQKKRKQETKKLQMPVNEAFPDLLADGVDGEAKQVSVVSTSEPAGHFSKGSNFSKKALKQEPNEATEGNPTISVPTLGKKVFAGHDDLFARVILNTEMSASAPQPQKGREGIRSASKEGGLKNIISNEDLFDVSEDDDDGDGGTQDACNGNSSGSRSSSDTSSGSGSGSGDGRANSAATSASSTLGEAVGDGTTMSDSSQASSSHKQGTGSYASSINDSRAGSVDLSSSSSSSSSVSSSSSASSLSVSMGGGGATRTDHNEEKDVIWIDIDNPREKHTSSPKPMTITENSDGEVWINEETSAHVQRQEGSQDLPHEQTDDAVLDDLVEDSIMEMSNGKELYDDEESSSSSSSSSEESSHAESGSHFTGTSSGNDQSMQKRCAGEDRETMSQSSDENVEGTHSIRSENNSNDDIANGGNDDDAAEEAPDSDSDVYIDEEESDDSTVNSDERSFNEEDSNDESHLISI